LRFCAFSSRFASRLSNAIYSLKIGQLLVEVHYDTNLYKLREKVERFFNNLKQFRGIATRYEKLSQTFLAFIHLVAAWILIK
jgi:transposase